MNLLFRIVYAAHANGTHHKLALDALRHLRSPNAERWQRLFLNHADVYLEGSKAPDKEFKDFKNHVLHVADDYWGGAPEKVESWYRKLVEALKARSWHEAVYAAGIMSHYYTDPIHPFHTDQSEAENNIHRAVEWSISRSYGTLSARNETKRLPAIELATDDAWIKDHVIAGAETSHGHYATLIAHYDFNRGVIEPSEGLDEVCKALVSDLLLYAAVGHARLLERAFEDAAVEPPHVKLTAHTFLAALEIPLKWVTRKLEDAADRRQVEAMYDELQAKGTVEDNLPADDRQIRDLHAREVLATRTERRNTSRAVRRTQSPLPQGQIPRLNSTVQHPAAQFQTSRAPSKVAAFEKVANAKPTPALARLNTIASTPPPRSPAPTFPEASQDVTPNTSLSSLHHQEAASAWRRQPIPLPLPQSIPRLNLTPSDQLEAAPSIGPKTAARFEAIGIITVADFLNTNPEATANALGTRHISSKTIVLWQHQARLMCTLPGIRGTHAQLLVGAGLLSVDALAEADPGEAMAAVLRFAQTSAGQSVLRDGQPPDLEKIHIWVRNARAVSQAA